MIRYALLLISLFITTVGSASQGLAPKYHVSVEALDHKAIAFASPYMTLQAGSAVKIEASGTEGYTLSLQITELPEGKVGVQGHFVSSHGEMTPKLVVSLGEPTTIKNDNLSLIITVHKENP